MALEQTISAPKTESFQTGRVMTVAAGHSVHDMFMAFLSPVLPLLIEKFSLAKAEAGAFSIFTTLPSLFNPFVGYLADHVELRYFVIFTPAVSTIAMTLLGIAPSYLVVALLLLVAGISSATLHGTGPVMAGNLAGNRLGRAMSIWMVGGELGRTLGPVVIVNAIGWISFANTPWLSVFGVLTSLFLWLRLRSIPVTIKTQHEPLPWRAALVQMRPLLVPLSGLVFFRTFLSTGLNTYLPTYLTESGESLQMAGAALSLLQAAGVLGALLGGSLSDRTGRRPVLIVALLISPLLLWLTLSLLNWTRFLAMILLGFFMLSTPPVIMAVVQEGAPESRALANGVYMAISFLAMSLAAVAVGAYADRFGLRSAFLASGAISLLSLPFVFFIPKRRHR